MHATVTWIKKFLWALKPGWLLSDAYWWLRERTNHRCLFCASLNPIFAYNRRCTNPAASYVSGWTCFTWSRCVCVCVFDSVTFHQPVTLSPCQSSRHEHQKELENVWMFLCSRCECEVPLVMPGFFVLSCRLFVFVCCCSPVCTFKHAQTHTQTSLLSNLSCPGLLSAIHFPVSQPSIIPACSQMQPSLLKTMRGNDVYRSRRRLRQAKRERGGGGFLIKIAIDWDS